MTMKEFFDKLILTPQLWDSDLKIQIGNHYIDIDNLHAEEDMIILHIPIK
jgi:hypothetical protein